MPLYVIRTYTTLTDVLVSLVDALAFRDGLMGG